MDFINCKSCGSPIPEDSFECPICETDTGLYNDDDDDDFYHSDENKKKVNSFKNGLIEVLEDGSLKIRKHYKNGQLNGLYEEFLSQQHLKSRGQYENGKKVGLWQENEVFDSDGFSIIKNEGCYNSGKRDGLWIETYPILEKKGAYTLGERLILVDYGIDSNYGLLIDENNLVKSKGYYKKGIKEGSWYFNEFHANDHSFDTYEGNYKKGLKNGTWSYFENGEAYSCEFKDDKLHGIGTCLWKSGDKYVGEWEENNMHGKGTYYYSDGSSYIGSYKDHSMHGKGSFTWANGTHYEGDFKDGQMDGKGTLTWANGNKYVGNFKHDKMHGEGIYNHLSGEVKKVFSKKGVMNTMYDQNQKILERFKVRISDVLDNQSWVVSPPKWQLCKTDGGNVVWNNTEKREKISKGEEVYVITLWKKNIISSGTEKFSEPTFYVDFKQTD